MKKDRKFQEIEENKGNPYKGGILQQAIGNGATRLTGSTDQQNSCPRHGGRRRVDGGKF